MCEGRKDYMKEGRKEGRNILKYVGRKEGRNKKRRKEGRDM